MRPDLQIESIVHAGKTTTSRMRSGAQLWPPSAKIGVVVRSDRIVVLRVSFPPGIRTPISKHVSKSSTSVSSGLSDGIGEECGVAGSGCGLEGGSEVAVLRRPAGRCRRQTIGGDWRPSTQAPDPLHGICLSALYFGSHRKRKRACSAQQRARPGSSPASWVMTLSSATMTIPVG